MIYGYIRVSTDGQSVENQKLAIRNFCRYRRLHHIQWISETISGTKKPEKRKLGKLFLNITNSLRTKKRFYPCSLYIAASYGINIRLICIKKFYVFLFFENTYIHLERCQIKLNSVSTAEKHINTIFDFTIFMRITFFKPLLYPNNARRT